MPRGIGRGRRPPRGLLNPDRRQKAEQSRIDSTDRVRRPRCGERAREELRLSVVIVLVFDADARIDWMVRLEVAMDKLGMVTLFGARMYMLTRQEPQPEHPQNCHARSHPSVVRHRKTLSPDSPYGCASSAGRTDTNRLYRTTS
jgi:hypothetical protein